MGRGPQTTRRSESLSIPLSGDESESDIKRKRKRRKSSTPPEVLPPAVAPALMAGADAESSQVQSEKPRAKRSRRLGTDAAAYRPDLAEESDSGEDKPTRRRLRPRKRTRGEDEGDRPTGPTKAKKRKVTAAVTEAVDDTKQQDTDILA